jgi:hypothetical protein
LYWISPFCQKSAVTCSDAMNSISRLYSANNLGIHRPPSNPASVGVVDSSPAAAFANSLMQHYPTRDSHPRQRAELWR